MLICIICILLWPKKHCLRYCHRQIICLTQRPLVSSYGVIELGQHWFRQWLGAWRHQVIAWINVDLSSKKFHGIHLRSIPQWVLKLLCCIMSLKNILLKLLSCPPGANELIIHEKDTTTEQNRETDTMGKHLSPPVIMACLTKVYSVHRQQLNT